MVIDNDIVQVNISNPEGCVTGIQYNGLDNLLEINNHESDRGYVQQLNFNLLLRSWCFGLPMKL